MPNRKIGEELKNQFYKLMWIKVEAFCSEDLNQSEYEKGGKPPKVVYPAGNSF